MSTIKLLGLGILSLGISSVGFSVTPMPGPQPKAYLNEAPAEPAAGVVGKVAEKVNEAKQQSKDAYMAGAKN